MFILLFQLPEAAFILGQRLATTGQVFLMRVSPTLTSAPFPQDPVVTLTHQDNSGHMKVSWHLSFYLQPYRLFYFLSKFIYFTSGLQSPLCPPPSPHSHPPVTVSCLCNNVFTGSGYKGNTKWLLLCLSHIAVLF